MRSRECAQCSKGEVLISRAASAHRRASTAWLYQHRVAVPAPRGFASTAWLCEPAHSGYFSYEDEAVHRATVEIYEERGAQWAARRRPVRRAHARAFALRVPRGELRVDLGCGAGRYTEDIGSPVIGFDAARTMLEQCRENAPRALLVQGDLEALPFGTQSLRGAWANMSYVHLPRVYLPLALADLHRSLAVGAPVDLQVLGGDYEGDALADDDVGGRFFCGWTPERLEDVMTGAGFEVENTESDDDVVRVSATRQRTLPDFVGPGMRLLVVGLNPSLYSADRAVGFARPGNRFWPAALAAGITERDRDSRHALAAHGVGMTDVVKRATVGAAELSVREYRTGMGRIERLVGWLEPEVVCFVGLSGWRAAVDRGARPGFQGRTLAGRPVYVMPSTSGANAHAQIPQLSEHLRAAAAVTSEERRGQAEGPGA
jgi:double-stranded uracil-DNA glycosylase